MTASLSQFRQYFRFTTGEKPREPDLNAGMVDKIDSDVNQLLNAANENAADISTLTQRVDMHADAEGNLIATALEFAAFPGGVPVPTFVSANQFYVTSDYSTTFTVNRAVKAILSGTSPVSTVKVVAYDGGLNRTTVTLWDNILDASLTELEIGFIKEGLPKIDASNLTFVPVTDVILNNHKYSGDHDWRYLMLAQPAQQVMAGPLLLQTTDGYPTLGLEDPTAPSSQYRYFRFQSHGQYMVLLAFRPDTGAARYFFSFDGTVPQTILQCQLNANGSQIVGLPAPSAGTSAARLVDIPVAGYNTVTQAMGDGANGGSGGAWALSNHRHGMPGYWNPVTQAFGDAASQGSVDAVARSDHRHGMPSLPALVYCRVSAPSLTLSSGSVDIAVPWTAEELDTNNFFTGGNPTVITFPFNGLYTVGVTLAVDLGSLRNLKFRLNGSTIIAAVSQEGGSLQTLYAFAAGHYIELLISNNSGEDVTLGAASCIWVIKYD